MERYRYGSADEDNYDKALFIFEKICNLNDGIGCTKLGELYARDYVGNKQDLAKAKTYITKSCDLNESFGCSGLGYVYRNIGNKEQEKIITRKVVI